MVALVLALATVLQMMLRQDVGVGDRSWRRCVRPGVGKGGVACEDLMRGLSGKVLERALAKQVSALVSGLLVAGERGVDDGAGDGNGEGVGLGVGVGGGVLAL